MEAVKALFTDPEIIDGDRRPLFAPFSIPGLEGQYILYPPGFEFWKQLVLLQLIQTMFQVLFAMVVYKMIVEARKQSTNAVTPLGSFIIGYGVVLPLSMYIPFQIIESLTIRNYGLKFSCGILPTIVVFRTMEAMHGTSIEFVEDSLMNYITYYTSVIHFEWDPKTRKTRKITMIGFIQSLGRAIYFFMASSLWLSFMKIVNYQPIESNVPIDSFIWTWDLLSWRHLVNAYCLAVLVYFLLGLGFELTAFGENVKGYDTKPIFKNPLFESRSIREFWGRRWNLTIHLLFKHGVYLPTRKAFINYGPGVSNFIATLATFFASGLLHEYSWQTIFYQYGEEDGDKANKPFSPIPMKVTLFFFYNGITMMIEYYYGRYITCFNKVPSIIVSTLVVFTAVPLSHWFSGDWVMGGYFDDFLIGLWQIKKLS